MLKNTFLILTFLILTFLSFPNTASAACGAGWFCGIDQGYQVTINTNGKGCYPVGNSYVCSNVGLYVGNRNYDCKNQSYVIEGKTYVVSTRLLDCSVTVSSNGYRGFVTWANGISSTLANSCNPNFGTSCEISSTAIGTTCCVRETCTPYCSSSCTYGCSSTSCTGGTCNSEPPPPVNGVCSDPDTHYTCAVGTSTNQVDGATAWTWTCAGSNGGTNASCSENKIINPSCTSVGPAGNPTIPYSQSSYDVYAYGVADSTTVGFWMWSDIGWKDDLIGYPGTNLGGGTWKATVNPARNTSTGQFYVQAYLNDYIGGVYDWTHFCGQILFTRDTPSCTISLTPSTASVTVGGGQTLASVVTLYGGATLSGSVNYTKSNNNVSISPTSGSSTNVTGVIVGSTTITATQNLTNGSPCTDTTDITITAAPYCTVSLTPSSTSVLVGGTQALTATTTLYNGAIVSRVDFAKSNSNVNLSPTADTSSPYSPTSTNVTGVTAGSTTVTSTVTLSNGSPCTNSSAVTVTAVPYCTISLTPPTASVLVGSGQTFIATTTTYNGGVVSRVDFTKNNNNVSISPTADTSSPYSPTSTTATGVTAGSTVVTATASLSNGSPCTDTSDITVSNIPYCTVSLTPSSANVLVGGTQALVATTTLYYGATVSRVDFTKSNNNVSISPTADTSSPYSPTSTNVTGVTGGSTTVTSTVTLSNGSPCTDTTAITVPALSCTLSLTPSSATVGVNGNQVLTATTSVTNGSISRVDFTRNNSNVSISPTADTSSPYSPTTTTATGVNAGSTSIVTARATLNDGTTTCSDTTTITVSSPSCTVSLNPSSATITLGETVPFVAVVSNIQNGTVTQVNFLSEDTSTATVSPASDSTSTYSTVATGVGINTTTVRADVVMNGASRCNDTSSLTVEAPSAWWQVKDGDVTTNGDIVSNVPDGQLFDVNGNGGFPGVPVFGGAFNLEGDTSKISTQRWYAHSSTTQGRLFNYSYFDSLIPDDVVPIVATDASLRSTGFSKYGYEWYITTSDLSINSSINFNNRKVILLLNGANLNINGNINLTDNSGFFGTFVTGNINLNSSITQLEGIYVASGTFNTNTGTNPLWVRGSVAAYGGISLRRDLVAGNLNNPSEIFEFGPDQVMLFPDKFSYRRTKWVEVAP